MTFQRPQIWISETVGTPILLRASCCFTDDMSVVSDFVILCWYLWIDCASCSGHLISFNLLKFLPIFIRTLPSNVLTTVWWLLYSVSLLTNNNNNILSRQVLPTMWNRNVFDLVLLPTNLSVREEFLAYSCQHEFPLSVLTAKIVKISWRSSAALCVVSFCFSLRSTMIRTAVQFSRLQNNSIDCSTMLYIEVQFCRLECNTINCSTFL